MICPYLSHDLCVPTRPISPSLFCPLLSMCFVNFVAWFDVDAARRRRIDLSVFRWCSPLKSSMPRHHETYWWYAPPQKNTMPTVQKLTETACCGSKCEDLRNIEDDGTGGEWEQSTGLSKQAQKRKEKQEQMKKEQDFQRLRCQAVALTSWSVYVSFDVSCTVSCMVSSQSALCLLHPLLLTSDCRLISRPSVERSKNWSLAWCPTQRHKEHLSTSLNKMREMTLTFVECKFWSRDKFERIQVDQSRSMKTCTAKLCRFPPTLCRAWLHQRQSSAFWPFCRMRFFLSGCNDLRYLPRIYWEVISGGVQGGYRRIYGQGGCEGRWSQTGRWGRTGLEPARE